MMAFADAFRAAPDGWLTEQEARVLWDAATASRNALEVGVYLGRSASIIAAAMAPGGGRLTLCDPWNDGHHVGGESGLTAETCRASVTAAVRRAGLADVEIYELPDFDLWRKLSRESGRRRFDFVYLDGDHSYFATLRSCLHWWGMLAPGGRMFIHDYASSGGGAEIARAIEDAGLIVAAVVGRLAIIEAKAA